MSFFQKLLSLFAKPESLIEPEPSVAVNAPGVAPVGSAPSDKSVDAEVAATPATVPTTVTRASNLESLMVGEALFGDGNEIAHIDLIMGPRGSSAEAAFANTLTNNKDGFTSLLAVVAPNLLCKPNTVMFNKVTIKNGKQATQMFGPAQRGVAMAVADCVEDGTIPADQADDLFICVGVFIHWLAEDDAKIQDFNYAATKLSIQRAVAGLPCAEDVVSLKATELHPFAAHS